MTDLMHCPSRQHGTILGYHHGKRYFMVKTDTGQIQNWTKSSTKILNEGYMTNKILMKLTTGDSARMFNVIERVFNTVEDAAQYLAELTRLDSIKDTDKKGQCAKLSNGYVVYCNYDIREIVKKIPPKRELWDWYPFDLNRRQGKKTLSMPNRPTIEHVPSPKKLTGKVVKLQDLTSDGRAARVVLRELVRKKQIVKNGRWEWQEGDPQLEIVRKALVKK